MKLGVCVFIYLFHNFIILMILIEKMFNANDIFFWDDIMRLKDN
jgi:hypothetical protein